MKPAKTRAVRREAFWDDVQVTLSLFSRKHEMTEKLSLHMTSQTMMNWKKADWGDLSVVTREKFSRRVAMYKKLVAKRNKTKKYDEKEAEECLSILRDIVANLPKTNPKISSLS